MNVLSSYLFSVGVERNVLSLSLTKKLGNWRTKTNHFTELHFSYLKQVRGRRKYMLS